MLHDLIQQIVSSIITVIEVGSVCSKCIDDPEEKETKQKNIKI